MKPLTLSLSLLILAATSTASAQEFTKPVPTLDTAVAQAKAAGKPLVIEFSATWCEPCKALAKDLEKDGKAVLEKIHFVVYQGDEGIGEELMRKLAARSFPTFVAFDVGGNEIARRSGYQPFPMIAQWFGELPDRAIPLDEYLKRADTNPKDGKTQLIAAKRLIDADRQADAKKYFTKAVKAGGPSAATGAWALARFDVKDKQSVLGRAVAEKMVRQYPDTEEGELAIRYLAGLPKPPVALLEMGLSKRLEAIKPDDLDSLNDLVYVALKAGALQVAEKMAAKLEQLAPNKPNCLDTAAEVFHMKGDDAKAIQMEEKVIAMAGSSNPMTSQFQETLERFKRGKKEPSRELLTYRSPSLEPDRRQVKLPPTPPPPAAETAARMLEKKIREECWQQASEAMGFYALVATAEKPADWKIIPRPGVSKSLEACAAKLIRSVKLGPGEVFEVWAATYPASADEAIEQALAKAKKDCKGTGTMDVALSAIAGQKPVVLVGAGKPEVRQCVEKVLSTIKLPTTVTVMNKARIEFGE